MTNQNKKAIVRNPVFHHALTLIVGILIGMLIMFMLKRGHKESYDSCPATYGDYERLMTSLSDSKPASDGSIVCRYGRNCEKNERVHVLCGSPFKKKRYCKDVRSVTFDKDDNADPAESEFSKSKPCQIDVGWMV